MTGKQIDILIAEYRAHYQIDADDHDFLKGLSKTDFAVLEKGVKEENPDAIFLLAVAEIRGMRKSEDDPVEILENLAQQKYPAAMYHLGRLLESSDRKKSRTLIEKAAESGYPPANAHLGMRLLLKNKVKKAITCFKAAADADHIPAIINLAQCYRNTDKDEKAFEQYLRAGEMGYPQACFILGQCFEQGFGTASDNGEAMKWFQKAAAAGIAEAQHYIERLEVEAGERKISDAPSTLEDIEELALKGNVEMQFTMGELYYVGNQIKQDFSEAVKWYDMAARQGHVKAQSILGEMYFNGQGVKENCAKALEYFLQSAKQGWGISQLNAGIIYAMGYDVDKNIEEAKKWFHILSETEEGVALLVQMSPKGVPGIQEVLDGVK